MNLHFIHNARVFDGTGRAPFPGAVLVEGNHLVVDGDPRADIAILQNREGLALVMKDGVVHRGRLAGPPV